MSLADSQYSSGGVQIQKADAVVEQQPGKNIEQSQIISEKEKPTASVAVMSWSNVDMLNWLSRSGYGRLSEAFLHHDIAGRHLPYINDTYLKEMGCDVVGERIALLEDLRLLQAESRRAWRKQILFRSDEFRNGPCYGFLPFRCWFFPCCFDPCVPIPEKYMVSNQCTYYSDIRRPS